MTTSSSYPFENDLELSEELDRLRREQEDEAISVIEQNDQYERVKAQRQLEALHVEAAGRDYEERQLLFEVSLQRRPEDYVIQLANEFELPLHIKRFLALDGDSCSEQPDSAYE